MEYGCELVKILQKHLNEKENTTKYHNFRFHYTSLDTALNIIGSQTLRATSSFYLNDPIEVKFGIKRVLRYLSRRKYNLQKCLFESWSSINTEIFVHSGTFIGDSLDHWTRYGDDGNGLALGFSSDMSSYHAPNGFTLLNGPVLYGYEINKLIDAMLSGIYLRPEDVGEMHVAFWALITACFFSKPYDWKIEKESRILALSYPTTTFISPSSKSFKNGKSGPYVEIPPVITDAVPNTSDLRSYLSEHIPFHEFTTVLEPKERLQKVVNRSEKELLPLKRIYVGPANCDLSVPKTADQGFISMKNKITEHLHNHNYLSLIHI